MKKLSILIALVLVLSFSLMAAVPVGANVNSITGAVTLGTTYTGIAEWTTETARCGDHSAKLVWPAPYRDGEDNYIVPRAFANIAIPSGLKVGDVSSWSYWIEAPSNYAPNLVFYVDTTNDGSADTTISAWPKNPDGVWASISHATIGGYKGAYIVWSSNPWPSYKFSWVDVQSAYGSAEIIKVRIGKGVIGTNRDITAYVDDFMLNDVTYVFEPPPTKADIFKDRGVPGKGLDKAPGLDKPFNPKSEAEDNAGRK